MNSSLDRVYNFIFVFGLKTMVENGEKKIEQIHGKYTELELGVRGIGMFRLTDTKEWTVKLGTYHDEGVRGPYMAIKRSMCLLLTDIKGYQYMEVAHKVAQVMIDKFLLQRSKGLDIPVPGPVVSESSLKPVPAEAAKTGFLKATAVKADFENWDGKIDTISDINWIYNHLMISDVTAADAPSPGAWAHLQYHKSTPAAMSDFFTKVYPRLIPAKGAIQKLQDKFHDDGRTTFDLLDRLLAEDEGSAEPLSVLPMVLPKRPGLQDSAGQSTIPQEGS